MDAAIIVTYRCPMRCKMCNIWANPTEKEKEFKPEILNKLPHLDGINITGGEPFVRDDLDEIVEILFTKTNHIVFATSGYYPDRILKLANKYPKLGFRVSIEGLSQKNDELRGQNGGFDKGLRTLLGLMKLGVKDIGFGITVSNNNSEDMLWLYELGKNLNLQFATAAFHNSFYFHKYDNVITNTDEVCSNLEELVNRLLKENKPKSWFRAFFNMGLINYVKGGRRLLPCEAGNENFFIDPYGEILPCNGMEERYWYKSMGNLHRVHHFNEIWESETAKQVRECVANCPKKCWMVGTVSPVMKKYVRNIIPWIIINKINVMNGGRFKSDCIPFYHIGNNDKQGLEKIVTK